MTTTTTASDPTVHSNHPTRGRATKAKAAAIAEGWSEVKTAKTPDGTFDVVGLPPAPEAPAAPTPVSTPKAKKKPATAKPKSKPEPKAAPATTPRKKDGSPRKSTGVKGGRPVGVESGVGVEATWVAVFSREAAAPKSKRIDDAAITAEMQRNFPGRGSDVFRRVSTVRAKFNRGAFACQGGTAPAKKAEKK